MIRITVDTDDEKAAVIAAIRNGALPADTMTTWPRGGGEFASEPFGPYQIAPSGAAGGSGSSNSMVYHTRCAAIGGGGGSSSAPGGYAAGGSNGVNTAGYGGGGGGVRGGTIVTGGLGPAVSALQDLIAGASREIRPLSTLPAGERIPWCGLCWQPAEHAVVFVNDGRDIARTAVCRVHKDDDITITITEHE